VNSVRVPNLKEICMEEKEVPPVRLRKLKNMDEYREKIPVAWRFYQRALERGEETHKAELKAVKAAYTGDRNSSTILKMWKQYGLWPPSAELIEATESETDKRKESRDQMEPHLTVIPGNGTKKRRTLRDHADGPVSKRGLSEEEILRKVKAILDAIEVHHKEWTGGRRKKYSTLKTRVFAGRLPTDLINEIHKFEGSNTYHLERALRLYVKVLGMKE
jgi:hypothetical protein